MKFYKMEWVYKFIPVPVFLSDKIREPFSGYSRFVYIVIKPNCIDDLGLIEHELTHIRQFYRTLGLMDLLKHFSKRIKLNRELEAYINQANEYGYSSYYEVSWIVDSLIYDYELGIYDEEDIYASILVNLKKRKEKE